MTQNQIKRYRIKRRRRNRRKKTAVAFAGFLAVMLLFTLISRGVYASGLPQVVTESPGRSALYHTVETAGSVIPGRQLAVVVEAGIRIKEVLILPGDRVKTGDVLFLLDTQHLQQLIQEKDQEIGQLELQVATLLHNDQLKGEEKVREMNQTNLDGLEQISDAQTRMKRAMEDKERIGERLELHNGKADECETEADREIWLEKHTALAELYEQARRELEDAQESLDDIMAEISRRQQEVTAPLQTDASAQIGLMNLESMKKERAVLDEWLKAEGKVKIDSDAVILQVSVMPGDFSGNHAAVIYGDLKDSFYFETYLDKEEKKYVEQGMEAELKLGMQQTGKLKVTVDDLTPTEDGNGGYISRSVLPEGRGNIGQNGTLFLSVQSEIYPLCISLDAVHKDMNGRCFVYVAEETDTVLGIELVARKIMVEILDQNDSRAAISSSALDTQSELIVFSTKEFENGDVIRLKD